MEMDLDHNRYSDFEALSLYCHRVASVVGLLSAEIFGYQNPQTLEYAANLGMAFQLTNIIRDVGEDARRDRIYLPLGRTGTLRRPGDRHRTGARDREFPPPDGIPDRARARLLSHCLRQAAPEDRKTQRAGIVMAAIYQALLEEIRADGCRVLTQRTSLTPVRKLWIAWRTWLKG